MLDESYSISHRSASLINAALKEKRPIIAVGTTSVRALESAFKDEALQPGHSATQLFIYPGYKFRAVDKLLTNFHLPKSTLLMLVAAFAGLDLIKQAYHLTNFHLPKSTLLMLVAAFAGLDLIKQAYQEAVAKKYRFYSYGDCMLII